MEIQLLEYITMKTPPRDCEMVCLMMLKGKTKGRRNTMEMSVLERTSCNWPVENHVLDKQDRRAGTVNGYLHRLSGSKTVIDE